MGRWEPLSTHTHTHHLLLLLLPHPLPSCASVLPVLQSRMFFRVRSSAELSPSGAQQQQREERKEGRRKDCFAEISLLASYICRIFHNMRRGWCFPGGTTSHLQSLIVFKSLLLGPINFNRMLWFVDVFEEYSGSFFKELTCLVWFDLRLELGTERKACFCISMEWEQNLNWDWGVLTMTVSVQLLNHSVGLFLVVWGDNAVHGVYFESIDLFVWFYYYVHLSASRLLTGPQDLCFGSVLQDTQSSLSESEVNGETFNIIILCCHTHLDLFKCTQGNVVFAWVREYSVFSLPPWLLVGQ